MSAQRKYPAELRERAIKLVRETETESDGSRKGACRRVGLRDRERVGPVGLPGEVDAVGTG